MDIKKAIKNIFSNGKYIQMEFSEDGSVIDGFTYSQRILGLPVAYVRKHLDLVTGKGFRIEGSTFGLDFTRSEYCQNKKIMA